MKIPDEANKPSGTQCEWSNNSDSSLTNISFCANIRVNNICICQHATTIGYIYIKKKKSGCVILFHFIYRFAVLNYPPPPWFSKNRICIFSTEKYLISLILDCLWLPNITLGALTLHIRVIYLRIFNEQGSYKQI